MKKFLFIFFIFTFTIRVTAVTIYPVQTDTNPSLVVKRQVPREKIDRLAESRDFNYSGEKKGNSFMSKLLNILFYYLARFFSHKGVAVFFRYAIIAIVILLIVFNLAGTPLKNLFYPEKSREILQYVEKTEDIRQADLDELIAGELKQKNFNKAVRYYYIKLLKLLDEQQMIGWQPGKTNHDYYLELGNTDIQKDFSFLTFLYEYTWYGEFALDQQRYEEIASHFNSFFNNPKLNERQG